MLTEQNTASAQLLARFRQVRGETMRFAAPLSPEDLMVQSSPEASPVKWHLAHTSWFFETFVLSEFVAAYQPFHPDFRWLFNSYYNAVGDRPEKKLRASFSRPPLDDILAYRRHVDAAVGRLLAITPEDEAMRRIVLGLEHEQQHLELIATDIKHALFTNPLQPAYLPGPGGGQAPDSAASHRISPPLEWVSVSPGYPHRPGVAEIGITPDPRALEAFAFDNETPRHPVYIAPFRLASRLVTCAEYLAFLEEDGYSRPELWLSEGWDTVRAQGWEAPLYWNRADGSARREAEAAPSGGRSGWAIFTLHGWRALDDLSETPVCHLSFFEADAYARWAGHRLPTEAEWEFVAAQQRPAGNLLESNALHPTIASPTANTPQQMFGDVWEWTSSPYTGYPGYKPLPGALGEYNGKFMSSQMILRGGSCVTPETHIRATYRNFFGPATRWQFSGLRLARDGAS